jgi:glycosyltransferase involved in cell wall biosynthesis
MWNELMVSVILPTYNEKESIKGFIRELEKWKVIDEIIVINNNAAEGTREEVAQTSAKEVMEPVQGYGAAIQRGFKEAKGDLVVVYEPDDTFMAHDIHKLLAYAEDFEIVYGSRTTKELIWHGANMGMFLKWGNYAVAKLMEFLFNTTSLTDVGCTVRCIRKKSLKTLMPYFTVKGSFFGPEMMVLSALQKMKIIQIPVNYTKRIGHSSVTGNKWVAFILGLKMIWLILGYRAKSWLSPESFRLHD